MFSKVGFIENHDLSISNIIFNTFLYEIILQRIVTIFLWLWFYRFDQSTVELLLWYEAIFGKDMWKHVVAETTFWSHSEEAVNQRWKERGQVS